VCDIAVTFAQTLGGDAILRTIGDGLPSAIDDIRGNACARADSGRKIAVDERRMAAEPIQRA
jgi:hypothetical protein